MTPHIYKCSSDSFKTLFQESLKVYPCSYDPTDDLRELPGTEEGKVRCHLPLEAKALRFFMYCQENGKVGRINTSNYQLQTFTTPQIPLLGFVTIQADVYIDDIIVGSAFAGQCCDIGCTKALDKIVQYTSGLAKSRALTNAGFGIISGTDIDATLVPDQDEEPLPFSMNIDPVPTVAALTQSAGGTTAPALTAPPEIDPNQVNLYQQLGGTVDPLTQAKAMKYPLSGHYYDRTLGSLTKTRGVLEALANKTTNDPTIQAAARAARLILEDRNKANGKAN